MALIRALAIEIPMHTWSVVEAVNSSIEIVERVLSCLKRFNVAPWTTRVVFPPIPQNVFSCRDLEAIVNNISSVFGERKILIAFPLSPGHKCLSNLEAFESLDMVYFSTYCNSVECLESVVRDVYSKRYSSLDIFTRFAISFGMWIETPYFPATANTSNTLGFTASLRYVDLVSKALLRGDVDSLKKFLIEIDKVLRSVANCSSVPFLGIDFSLSPWTENEESVASLVESLINAKIGSPGTLNTLYSLNTFVKELPKRLGLRAIGFNEVMLPVAEDSVLSKRVCEGYVRVRDLVSYSFVCVAGLDMVALPRGVDIYRLADDMLTVYRVKNRVVAMRVIPTDLDELSEVKLKNFGTAYVAKL